MSMYKELLYENDIDVIKGIQFCIMGPDEIMSRSVAEITSANTFNRADGVYNGPFDARMGAVDHNKICPTCEQKNTFCPGHFGHIVMAKPVFFVQFFPIVKKLLTCVCFRCSKLLVDPENSKIKTIIGKKISRQKRWELIAKECKDVKKCGAATLDGCGARKPVICKEGVLKICMEWKEEKKPDESRKVILTAEDVLKILRRITDGDADCLGFPKKFNRPEYMICTVMPVPPPSVRPSVRNDNGQRSEDDMTCSLLSIIKYNNQLKEKIANSAKNAQAKDQIDIIWMLLQYEVAAFIDNTVPGIPPLQQRNGRANRSVIERLKSKEGRIRGNLMGKRVDFSARSVISPDPNIGIDELGVPYKIAMNLTFPEIVNTYNVDAMRLLVMNGPDIYPGAKFVRKHAANSYRTILLKVVDDRSVIAEDLKAGDVVERHLWNGDNVLFNRQPSLHKMSMMAHKVRVMPHHTFRLNVCVTAGYNADFDGDEMNMHVPQSHQSHEEIKQLAAVKHHIISPRESKPIVAIVQDICLGVFRMTNDKVRVSDKQLFNLMSSSSNFNGTVPTADSTGKWSGRQLLSTIIPKNINVVKLKTGLFKDNMTEEYNVHNVVNIANGEITSGTFDKGVYQRQTEGLVHSIYNEYGPDRTRDFFDDTQKLACNWLVLSGFSVGISDLIIDHSTATSFENIIGDKKALVGAYIHSIQQGILVNKTSKNHEDNFESIVGGYLNSAQGEISNLGLSQINEDNNRLINMIKSGSKGSGVNVSQMIGCLGQQNIDGKRVPYSFDNRTLPHFCKYDDGPESRGFVESSFIKGLNPQEFFFHAMAGREGLIDTAVQTSETGYIQRKLVKAMEDCKVNYDYSIRNASGSVIQFAYGDDGMDPTKIEKQSWPYEYLSGNEFTSLYIFGPDDSENNIEAMDSHVEDLKSDRLFLLKHILVKTAVVRYPICFPRIINTAVGMYKHAKDLAPVLTAAHVLKAFDCVERETNVSVHHHANGMFMMLVRAHLSPKLVIVKHRLCRNAFDYIMEQVKHHFLASLASPCDMVGVVAAQSIGEPSTQLTLNSVHHGTEMLFRIGGRITRCIIGEYIDSKVDSKVRLELHPDDTSLVWLKDDGKDESGVEVLSCDEDGGISWREVSAVTRHPSESLIQVSTRDGRAVIATKGDSFLMKNAAGKIVPVKGSCLRVGDLLPASMVFPIGSNERLFHWNDHQLDEGYGYSVGVYLSDQNLSEPMTDCTFNGCKRFPAELFASNHDFMTGVVHGYFQVMVSGLRMGCSVASESKGILQDMRQILLHFNIHSTIQADSGKRFVLVISAAVGREKDIAFDVIETIEEVNNDYPYAYDLTVEGTRTFNNADGWCGNDTFHSSGLASASKSVRGVPRLKELLSVSTKIKTPEMIVRFHPENSLCDAKEEYTKYMNRIRTIRFKDIVKTSGIYFDPDDKQVSEDVCFLEENLAVYRDDCGLSSASPWLLRFIFDKHALLEFSVTMIELHAVINNFDGDNVSCNFNDDNSHEVVFRIRLKIQKGEEVDDMLTNLKAFEHTLLENIVIKGIKNIENVCLDEIQRTVYNPSTGLIENTKEFVVYTVGTNLKEVLSRDDVDTVRSTTNDVYEIYEVLGIEAARIALYEEILSVLGESTVDYRHVCLLIDVMTNKGGIMPINRHGINRSDIGPLAKSSFEEMDDKLIMAGIFGEYDRCNGVSANIMLGQITPCGTGDVEVLIDEEMLSVPDDKPFQVTFCVACIRDNHVVRRKQCLSTIVT